MADTYTDKYGNVWPDPQTQAGGMGNDLYVGGTNPGWIASTEEGFVHPWSPEGEATKANSGNAAPDDLSGGAADAEAVDSGYSGVSEEWASYWDPENLVLNPEQLLDPTRQLSGQQPQLDPETEGTNIDPNQDKYQMDPKGANVQSTATASQVDPRDAATYDAETTYDKVAGEDMEAAQGQVSQNALVDPEAGTIDMQGAATGVNKDGTPNWAGEALKEYAEQDLDAVDPKATMKGQLDILQSEFIGPDGQPTIPFWAQATARSVSKIAAFKGMTGTAATAAMSQAMLESSIQIAEKDAAFYQTLTLTNLNNKQQQTINRAGVLANMEMSNADARLASAIQNAQSFLAMDMKNLDNEQQARVINNQNRIQSILEDAKAINTQRLFTAEAQNNMDMFYDNLNSSIEQFNAASLNETSRFNATMENDREKFYKEMQYNIDTANAKWRQTVTLAQAEMDFEAAATDVQNIVGLTTEALNQIWDRSDALLDYAWKSSESELDRIAALAAVEMEGEYKLASEEAKGEGALWGSLLGNFSSSALGNANVQNALFGWLK